jgi:hypothetical protein
MPLRENIDETTGMQDLEYSGYWGNIGHHLGMWGTIGMSAIFGNNLSIYSSNILYTQGTQETTFVHLGYSGS